MKQEYLDEIKAVLKEDYEAYIEALQQPAVRGFRVNTLKIDPDSFFSLTGWQRRPTPFAANGFYLDDDLPVSQQNAYAAALFYMQEPSASASVTWMDPKPGMKILDLCAAPGSKTTQIAEAMQGRGLLVANEIDPARARILVENVERHGIRNCLVVNADPRDVAAAFPEYYDMVLVDAPCSGEGMFRKEPEAVQAWSLEHVQSCARRQAHILDSAWETLKPGGILQYSTCTLNTAENEETIAAFTARHPDMHVIAGSGSFGHPGISFGNDTELARRVYPMDGGEGHFVCRLQKVGEGTDTELSVIKGDPVPRWLKEQLKEIAPLSFEHLLVRNDRVYAGVWPMIKAGRCRIMRHQVLLGEIRRDRFEPDYAWCMADGENWHHRFELDDRAMEKYMRGESIPYHGEKGWFALLWHGYPVGHGRGDGSQIKNKLPKALRRR
ncbi:MAG: NOL1/NOP2/sun family putative RNA methylase [Solobacterium sp.]|nr:NOL1/NOP2/sun family putative RNA methylase [Solobacterium sp.]